MDDKLSTTAALAADKGDQTAPISSNTTANTTSATTAAANSAASNGTPLPAQNPTSMARPNILAVTTATRAPVNLAVASKPMAVKTPVAVNPVALSAALSNGIAAQNILAEMQTKAANAALTSAVLSGGSSEGSTETKTQPSQTVQKEPQGSTETKEMTSAKKGVNWWLVGGIGGGVLLVVAVVVIILVARKKK